MFRSPNSSSHRNVKEEDANALATISSIPLIDDSGKYLSVPSIHGRVKNKLYSSVVERVLLD